eukprot:sb/3474239/
MSIIDSCQATDSTLVYCLVGYAVSLLIVSSIMGFLTRKVPDNFKESMHIFLCSLITLAVVSTFVPAMVLLPGKKQVFSMAIIVTLLALCVNCIIFIPKLITASQTASRQNTIMSHHSASAVIGRGDSDLQNKTHLTSSKV